MSTLRCCCLLTQFVVVVVGVDVVGGGGTYHRHYHHVVCLVRGRNCCSFVIVNIIIIFIVIFISLCRNNMYILLSYSFNYPKYIYHQSSFLTRHYNYYPLQNRIHFCIQLGLLFVLIFLLLYSCY